MARSFSPDRRGTGTHNRPRFHAHHAKPATVEKPTDGTVTDWDLYVDPSGAVHYTFTDQFGTDHEGFSFQCDTGTSVEIKQLRTSLEYVGLVRDGMIFPWFSVLADDPGFYTLFPDLESWQETQEPFNLREHFGDNIKEEDPEFMYEGPKRIVGEEYFHHISGDYNIVELRAVLTSVDRITNELTGIDWLKCEVDCRFPLTDTVWIGRDEP